MSVMPVNTLTVAVPALRNWDFGAAVILANVLPVDGKMRTAT